MKLSSLIYDNEYRSASSFEDREILHIARSIDSIVAKTLFVCIRGKRVDTHALIREAVAAGASAIIVEIGCGFQRIPGIPILEVPSSRIAYAYAWSRFCGSPEKHLRIVGITGTNGKTSTAHILCSILRHAETRCGLIGTVRFETNDGEYKKSGEAKTMTTPEPETLYPLLAEMVKNGMTHAVMEVSSHALCQGRVAPIAFDVAIFTNISPEHLDYHGTIEAYLEAKASLFRQCRCSVVHLASPEAKQICQASKGEIFTCGRQDEVAAYAKIMALDNGNTEGTPICLTIGDETAESFLPIPGSFSLDNAVCASLAAHLLGVPIKSIAEALPEQEQIPGRMETIMIPNEEFRVMIDYAHTERALRSLLMTVRALQNDSGRILLLFGCGGERDRSKRAAMGRCAQELADFTIVTSDNSRREDPKQIIREILVGMPNKKKRRVIVRRDRAIAYAVAIAKPGDLILLVGKGHERYDAVGGKLLPFDERKIVYAALEARKNAHTILDLAYGEKS